MTIKRAIAIGTLSAITITLIAFGIKTKSFKPKTTTPFAQSRSTIRINVKNKAPEYPNDPENPTENQVTNLTNTYWTFNTQINGFFNDTWNINFLSNEYETTYTGIYGEYIAHYFYLYYINQNNMIEVYNDHTYFENNAYQSIKIVDGEDIDNTDLIAWLYDNATIENPPTPTPTPSQTIEVIPIMPMMFKILTMPFTFISQAFNVTLWENTPYEFNFSNFILSLIAIATLLFIIKLFTSGFSIIGNYSANHESRALKRSQTKLNNAKTEQIKSGNNTKPSKKG